MAATGCHVFRPDSAAAHLSGAGSDLDVVAEMVILGGAPDAAYIALSLAAAVRLRDRLDEIIAERRGRPASA